MTRTRILAAVAVPVVTIGIAAALVAPSIATASTASTSSTSPDGGSLSLTLTAPRALQRSHAAYVNCTDVDGTYRAAVKTTIRSVPVRLAVSVPSYDGAGSYSGSSVTLSTPYKTVIRMPHATADLTATGGSFTFDRTGRYGVHYARHRRLDLLDRQLTPANADAPSPSGRRRIAVWRVRA